MVWWLCPVSTLSLSSCNSVDECAAGAPQGLQVFAAQVEIAWQTVCIHGDETSGQESGPPT